MSLLNPTLRKCSDVAGRNVSYASLLAAKTPLTHCYLAPAETLVDQIQTMLLWLSEA
jgi:hypothetical protein